MIYKNLHWIEDFNYSEIKGVPYELPEDEDFLVGHYILNDFPEVNLYIDVENEKVIKVWLNEEE